MIRTLAFVILASAGAAAQAPATPPTGTPDARAILRSALDAHGAGSTGASTVGGSTVSVWFQGSIRRRSAEGDHNEFGVEQFYTRAPKPDKSKKSRTKGKRNAVVETIATRLEAKGTGDVAIKGFTGKLHFIVERGKRKIIDYQKGYKSDLELIKDDLTRTRFVVDTFVAGRLLRSDATVTYVRADSGGGMESHVIDHTIGGERLRYYVNRKPGTPPYFLGIEFPATKTTPQQNLCFALKTIHDFDGLRLPREMKVFVAGDDKADTSLWIRYFSLRAKKPAWLAALDR